MNKIKLKISKISGFLFYYMLNTGYKRDENNCILLPFGLEIDEKDKVKKIPNNYCGEEDHNSSKGVEVKEKEIQEIPLEIYSLS